MKKILPFILFCFFISSCTKAVEDTPEQTTQGGTSMDHSMHESKDENVDLTSNLSESPRHQEWVEINNNGKIIYAFVVYPENKEKSAAVMMIHENKWLNDWARSMADQIAAEGYIVVAPDLLSSYDATIQKTSDFASPDDATQALYALSQETITSDLSAVSKYIKEIESYNGNLVSAWFCWGGTQSFNYATQKDDLKASFVFYGTAPEESEIYSQIDVPVYAFYGEKDDRVNATIENTEKSMKENGKTFEYEIYPGAGHAFMRNAQSEGADELTKQARESAFERMKDILQQYK